MAIIDVAMESTSQEILSKVSSGGLNPAKSLETITASSSSPFSVTGKGKAILNQMSTLHSSYRATIIVDDVELFDNKSSLYPGYDGDVNIELEFTKSFKLETTIETGYDFGACVLY